MEERYQDLEMEIISFDSRDVITTSGDVIGEGDEPFVP